MAAIFLKLFNMGIAAGWLILAVLVLRLLLKKAPKWVSCLLWVIVAVRLVSPFSLESGWSLIPSAETIVSNVVQGDAVQGNVIHNDTVLEKHEDALQGVQNGIVQNVQSDVVHSDVVQSEKSGMVQDVQGDLQTSVPVSVPIIRSGVTVIDRTVNHVLSESFAVDSAESGTGSNLWHSWTQIASVVWLSVAGCILLYALISFLRLKRRVKASIRLHDNVYVCDEIPSPFILGIIKPRIFLPSGMDGETKKYVIAHENTHLRRRDHWWKPFGYILLAVYWFHPLSWIAYILFCRDIEMACDEKAVQTMEREDKASYAQALLDCSFPRRMVVACPLAFGEIGVKERVKAVLHYKRPAFWIVIVAIIACVAMAVCFLTDPKEMDGSMDELVKKGADVVSAIDVESNSKETPETPCENKQIFGLTDDSKVAEALNAYRAVWNGETDMIDNYTKSRSDFYYYLDEIGHEVTKFAVLDLDDDKIPEVVLLCSPKGTDVTNFYYILHYDDGHVYSDFFSNRQFDNLKTDGTFRWDGGGGNDGFATISFTEDKTEKTPYTYDRFTYTYYYEQDPKTGEWTDFDIIVNHQGATRAEFDKAFEEQDHKPDVTWYEFTEENIEEFFPFIPDPPTTTTKSVDFIVGATVVDKQIFDWTNSQVTEAAEAYRDVLTGQKEFCFFSNPYGPLYDDSVKKLKQLENFMPESANTFAIIDLDNDNLPEVVLSFGEYSENYCILKYYNNDVYIYTRGIRGFNTLKMDGTFRWANSGFEAGIGTLLFRKVTTYTVQGGITETEDKVYSNTSSEEFLINDQHVTREEEQKAFAYQDSKPDATWYDFSEGNVKKYLSATRR